MEAGMIRKDKIVELSHRIVVGKEHFKLETRVDDVTKILPQVKHRPDVWYMLGEVTYCTHVGTHIEVPFHHKRDGADIADFPFRQLIGPLVILDFRHKKPGESISLDELKAHEKKIHAGDIVFLWSGMDKVYHDNERWNDQPHLTIEANKWLVEKKIGCLGSDASGLEVPGTDYQPNHQAIMDAGIPMIESLKGLDQVATGDWIVFILPLPIVGLEASPLRVIAIPREELHGA
jgi:arylformamidase